MAKFWTTERIEEASKMWNDGLSATQIAKVLGCPRNAVLGITHRKRSLFPKRPQRTGGRKSQKSAAPKMPKAKPAPSARREVRNPPPLEPVLPAKPAKETTAPREAAVPVETSGSVELLVKERRVYATAFTRPKMWKELKPGECTMFEDLSVHTKVTTESIVCASSVVDQFADGFEASYCSECLKRVAPVSLAPKWRRR